MKKEPCECERCNEARMLAAWCVLIDEPDNEPRWAASLLLRRWERLSESGAIKTPPEGSELLALQVCARWIQQHRKCLARMHRHVAISGDVVA